MSKRIRYCAIVGCPQVQVVRGWCRSHYSRWYRHGDPLSTGFIRVKGPMAHYLANKDVVTDECKIWPFSLNADGYGRLAVNGKMYGVHLLACLDKWGPPPTPGMFAAHGPCHNPACWNSAHLSWETPYENMEDRRRDGTMPQGESHVCSKLTESQVRDIRQTYASGGVTLKTLGSNYGVHFVTISDIVTRRTWKHVV